VSTQNPLADWIEAAAAGWLAGRDAPPSGQGGNVSPEVQRDLDDAELARELAGFVRALSDSDPESAVLLEQIDSLEPDGWDTDGTSAERLRSQMSVLRRRLNTVEAKRQAVETVVRSLFAEKQG
jgi:hypothetical protein